MAKKLSKERQALIDKQRKETPEDCVYCESCGCKRTPKGSAVCVRCKGEIAPKSAPPAAKKEGNNG